MVYHTRIACAGLLILQSWFGSGRRAQIIIGTGIGLTIFGSGGLWGETKGRSMGNALIVIDVQNDFCPGGALAVADGDAVVGPINAMIAKADTIILTQDWHPADHASFAENHDGAAAFSTTEMPYGTQVLWPAHCIQGRAGAAFHPGLHADRANLIVRKGFRRDIDSYSAFFENDKTTKTGLAGYLRDRGIDKLTFAGLATDFCVAWSALDAVAEGFAAHVALDACRAIDLDGSLDVARTKMQSAGITLSGG